MSTTPTPKPTTATTTVALATATGSHQQHWYSEWLVTNHGTTTSFVFYRDCCPAPYFRRDGGGLVYDPWTVADREVRPYENMSDRVVLPSAERAWLRAQRRGR